MSEISQQTKEMSAHLSLKYQKWKHVTGNYWSALRDELTKKHFSFVFLPSTLFHISRHIYNGVSVV